jgi:hypothetical protein
MSTNPLLPRAQASIVSGQGVPTTVFYNFLLSLADSTTDDTLQAEILELAERVSALENADPTDATIQGLVSVRVDGTLAGGAVVITLQGDVEEPGFTYYYGTDATGVKGWFAVADTLAGTTDQITKDVGLDGVTTFGLSNIPNLGDGEFQVFYRDAKGRVASCRVGTTDDVPEGLANLFFTNERAQDAVGTIVGETADIRMIYEDSVPEIVAELQPEIHASLDRADSAVQSIVAGTNISVDATDPQNPIVSSTATGGFPVMDFIPDPATATAADVYDTVVALLAELRDTGRMGGPPMTLTGTYPDATIGSAYSHTLTLGGGFTAPVTYDVFSGALPVGAGWTFDTATSELANASPVTEETATFVIRATDSSDPVRVAYSASQTVDVATAGTLMIFGNNDALVPGAGFPGDIDRSIFSVFTKAEAGPVQSIFARFRSDSTAGGNARVLIYNVSGGYPNALRFSSDIEAVPAGGGTVAFGITGDISLVDPAGDYALIVVSSDFNVQFGKRDTTGQTRRKEGIDISLPPTPFPGPADDTYVGDTAVWCEYLGP